jgi:hypothetical protein
MRLIFFFIAQLTGIISSGQKDLEIGDVITDTAFNCSDSLHRKFSERLFSIAAICDSKNDIEIRLISSSIRLTEVIIFSYKDGKWDAKKYINSVGGLGWKQTTISLNFSTYDGMYPEYHPCIHILNHLIDNKIFLVPDQSKSIPEEYFGHGRFLTLLYKTKDLFRSYSFQYPDSYLQKHPDSKEYVYLKEIVKTLREIFE